MKKYFLIAVLTAFSLPALAGQCKVSEAEQLGKVPAQDVVKVQKQIGPNSGSNTNEEIFAFTLSNGAVYTVRCEFVPYMGGCSCDPAQVSE